jgi:hypothetical protein
VKCLRFLPFAFLAGIHGFDLFAPYAALVLAAVPLVSRLRRGSSPDAVPAEVPAPELSDDLLPAGAE